MHENLLYSFLKFSNEKEYLNDLVKNGVLYFNHYSNFFSQKGEVKNKFDNSEGASHHLQPEDIKHVTIGTHNYKVASTVTGHFTPPKLQFIYCLYAITENSLSVSSNNQLYDSKLWEDFGKYVVFIHNTKEFKNRIVAYFEKNNIGYSGNLVEYVDSNKYSGELGIFRKKHDYKYQNEYRFAICPNTDELNYPITIGDISDIAHGPVHMRTCLNQYVDGFITI